MHNGLQCKQGTDFGIYTMVHHRICIYNPYIHLDLSCEHAVRDSTTIMSLIYDGGLL